MLLTDAAVWGSSPLTRGKPGTRRPCTPSSGAHPRSRGENFEQTEREQGFAGSSPLTRGKLRRTGPRSCQCRLIPAHAGKTLGNRLPRYRNRAHPRSRGENILHLTKPLRGVGSSPLTRGKLFHGVSLFRHCRLIPAHAGKTTPNQRLVRIAQAHPRSRGENDDSVAEEPELLGSSPLTRGKRALRR